MPATVEVGTGDAELPGFEPIPKDDRLPLFLGPQAGYHVYIQARAEGICGNSVAIDRTLREPGGTVAIRHQSTKLRLRDEGDGTFAFPHAVATFICPATSLDMRMDDRPFDLEVTLTEDPGCDGALEPRSVTTLVTVIPTCNAYDSDCSDTNAPGCAPIYEF